MTTKQIEKLIEKAYTEMGLTPIEAHFGGPGCACPMTAAYCAARDCLPTALGVGAVRPTALIAETLGKTTEWVWGVISGFDQSSGAYDLAGKRFGVRMRRRWLKKGA